MLHGLGCQVVCEQLSPGSFACGPIEVVCYVFSWLPETIMLALSRFGVCLRLVPCRYTLVARQQTDESELAP